MKRTSSTQHVSRSGFSLVELLVVIGIIAILVTILVIAIGPTLTSARIAATRTTIAQIDDVIQKRVDAIARLDLSVEAKRLNSLNSSITKDDQAEFFLRKNLYRQALPQRPEDIYGFDLTEDTAAPDDDAPFSADWTGPATSGASDEVDAAELFYFVMVNGGDLQVLPNGKTYTVPTIVVDDIDSNHIADTDGDGLPEFVDDWGRVLRFYNFPTRLIRDGGGTSGISTLNARSLVIGLSSDTTNNGPLGQDPLDPSGLLQSPFSSDGTLTFKAMNESAPRSLSFSSFTEPNYHTLNTYYAPLLVSAGPDQTLGLGEPIDADPDRLGRISTVEDITDNITNRQQ